jgi:tetratricopeptide (TPR) repeat protein
VIGKDVPFGLLEAIVDEEEVAIRRSLSHLQAAEFLYEARLFPELEYTFKHALTHEVAYGSLLHDRRRDLHAKVFGAIETLYSDATGENVDRLAHHALRGELWHKAVRYLRQAGARAAGRSALREATTCFEQALGALVHLADGRDTLEQAIDLRVELRQVLFPLGEVGRVFEYLHEAEALAHSLEDQRRLGQVSASMVHYYWAACQPDRAIIAGERAVDIAETLGDLAVQVDVNFHLGLAYISLGDYRRALECLVRNITSLQGDLARERLGMTGLPSVLSRSWSVMCLAELGQFENAIAPGEEAVRIAEAVDHPFSVIRACLQLGALYQRKGEFDKAIPLLERGLRVCEARQIPFLFPWIGSALGHVYALINRFADALPLLEAAAKPSSTTLVAHQSIRLAYLGEGYLLAGRLDDATVVARRAVDLSREHKERGHEAWSIWLLAEIASTSQDGATEPNYREAMSIAEELGMRPLVAHCHRGLGKFYFGTDDRQRSHSHLESAATMYREMAMQFWLEKAEAQVRELVSLASRTGTSLQAADMRGRRSV